jgi:hypothetical protein
LIPGNKFFIQESDFLQKWVLYIHGWGL